MFRTSNGQLAFRTTEAGKLTIYPLKDQLNLQGSSDIFELDFPATSILFLKNFETVLKGSLLIELPKEEESDKETVLNTYVYSNIDHPSTTNILVAGYLFQDDSVPFKQ